MQLIRVFQKLMLNFIYVKKLFAINFQAVEQPSSMYPAKDSRFGFCCFHTEPNVQTSNVWFDLINRVQILGFCGGLPIDVGCMLVTLLGNMGCSSAR